MVIHKLPIAPFPQVMKFCNFLINIYYLLFYYLFYKILSHSYSHGPLQAKVLRTSLAKRKLLNFENSANGNTSGYAFMLSHDTKELHFLGVLRKFKCYRSGYARVTSPEELVLKDKASIKLLMTKANFLLEYIYIFGIFPKYLSFS